MSTTTMARTVLVACVAMAATSAFAEDQSATQAEIDEMRGLVLELQDQMAAQQQQIDTQRQVIDDAGLEDDRGARSRLSSFLETTDFSGWVAASYFYSTRNPKPSNPNAVAPYGNPFHPGGNDFQFDEAWFSINREPTDESPAGFQLEILYGATATALATTTNTSRLPNAGTGNLNGNDIWVNAANVSYMTPWGPTITAGKFGTTIGYEIAGAPSNVNITRSFTYNLLQPFSQTGALVSQEFDSGFMYTIGAVNGLGNQQPDTSRGKGLLWQLGWANDQALVTFNGMFQEDVEGGPGSNTLILDNVIEFTPADNLLIWSNFTFFTNEVGCISAGAACTGEKNPYLIGYVLGGRVGVTDKLGIGGRFEIIHAEDDGLGGGDGQIYGGTLTTDYALTDNLTWKLEGKYEAATENLDNVYARDSVGASDDTFYLGTQLYYEF